MTRLLLSLFLTLSLSSCITSEDYGTTPSEDFRALWTIIDEHYCFFDYKREQYGLDWDEVRRRYAPQINDSMPRQALFEVLGKMCGELRDGHVNLWAAHDVARYTNFYEAYPANFSDSLERKYLGTAQEYRMGGTLRYKVLHDNIGYLRCSSFASDIGEGNLAEAMRYLATADGLIVDLRSNGGGLLTAAQLLASAFINRPTLVGYISHKTGRGHTQFSSPQPITLKPFAGLRWQKPVVVLTNRRTYSAANAFVAYVSALPNVTLMGDRTGGGSGLPFSSELPGGWSIRFSASPIYDSEMHHTEFGIEPDLAVHITAQDYQRSIDTIIERAIDHLLVQAKRLPSDAHPWP